ncbi:MAG TPA: tyrosine-type recombinase/integrase [Ramlibacter sp.]|jgi:integrase
MPLTVKELEALKATDHGRRLTDGGSLKGRVYAARNGSVSVQFRFAYKLRGKCREVLIGTWPKAGLAEIRKERDALRVQIQRGEDPVEQNQALRSEQQAQREAARVQKLADAQEAIHVQQLRLRDLTEKSVRLTVRSLFEEWQRLELVQRADKGRETGRSFRRDVFPILGDLAAADVTKAHIQMVLDSIKSRATATQDMVRTAKKTLADLRQMFGFALDRDYVEADPTARIKKARLGANVERDRVIAEPELIELFRKLPDAGLVPTSQLALKLQLATATRIGEVLAARWENFDLERQAWTIPLTKNGKRHVIWLSSYAMELLKDLGKITGRTPWLFPASQLTNAGEKVNHHVNVKTVTKQVSDRQRTTALAGRSKKVNSLLLQGGKWTPHDLRRTGATIMAELGALPDVVERCLNHIEEQRMKRIYQRAQYEAPMREAWRVLGERLALTEKLSLAAAGN